MLHNSGPYGPNDVPINMGIPVNMTQMSNPMNLGHNLGNLPKMPQQAPETAAPVYDITDYRSFDHSPLNMGHPMTPFPNYHQMNFQTNYVHPNLPHNTTPSSLENNILPMNLNTHSEHGPSLMNYHNPESKKFDINNLHYRESLTRKVPINIPQLHTKGFQKHLGMETNHDQCDTVQESPFYSHDSKKVPEKSIIDSNRRKSLENTVKLIEDILINSTPKDKLKNVNNESILNNTLNKSSSDMRNTKLHGIDGKELQSVTVNLSHKITHDPTSNTNLLRTRLEVQDTKSDIHGLNLSSKSSPNESIHFNPKLQNLEEDHTTTKKNVTKEMPELSKTQNEKELPKIQSEIHCEPLRRSLMNIKQTEKEERRRESNGGSDSENEDLIAEVDIKKEVIEEVVQIKVELVECTENGSSPFLNDSNAIPRFVLDVDDVIVEENNVALAKEAAKKGLNPKTYFECSHCGILFRHPKRFLIHTKWHTFGLTNEMRHKMEKERELRKSMKREARIIERLNAKEVKEGAEGDVHPCKDCDKIFSVKSSLKNHRQKYHPTRVRECKICKASVTGWMALRAHMASHAAGAAPGFACPECPKRFKFAHSLAKHRDTHLEKTLSCEQCSKMFGSQALLKMHMKCHERAARGASHRCTYCGKGFFESYNLQVHERTHRNERPFTCDICKTSFGTNSSLKRHLKVSHSSSKPYTCETCHRSFASSTTRARHTARAHGDASAFPHKCALCPRQYSALKELQRHISKTHREERDRGEIG